MKKKTISLLMLLVLLVVTMLGCGSTSGGSEQAQAQEIAQKAQAATDSQEKKDSEKTDSLKEKNEIPEDGVITAEQFATVAGKDQTVEFDGASEGMTYSWIFHGSKIQNPIDQNLLISLTNTDVDKAKKLANNATVGIGLAFQNSGDQIALPQITINLEEKLDADTLVLCGIQDDKAGKICDVSIDNSTDQSVLTFSPAYTNGTYYIVGGSSKTGTDDSEGSDDSEKAKDTKDTESPAGNTDAAVPTDQNQDAQTQDTDNTNVCTVSITCATIRNNMDKLTEGKEEFVPPDGLILAPSQVEFTPGENAHDVLTRVCQQAGIQMESSFTPAYNSAYIEGINQLYEFDCGELSGWMFSVNGWFPNYGSSLYQVEPGDDISFVFTCDLGRDIGGEGSSGNGNGGR